ncbi:MAG: sulfatase-like hydrolase/transferase [Saprospiraceae bacterium]|nr:sulfatase-like hydrolase/transferase [Saprospiraceae bacterium]
MKSKSFFFSALISCSLLSVGSLILSCSDSSQPPNIVILLADDLGYGDLRCYGGIANTPNIDRLASNGIRFSDFYAAAPNCSPSRVGLLTGREPSEVGMYNYLAPNHPMHLRSEELTLAEMLKERKYHTGHFGKWHVSCLPQNPELNQPQPHDQGFDYSFGTENNAIPSHLDPVNFVRNGKPVGLLQGYSCDLVVEEAISWLKTISKDPKPYLLYVAFHEPHKVVASPPELIAKYAQHSTQDAEYFANIENMDRAVGRLLEAMSNDMESGNTLILFASDNGSYRNGSNGKLLGGKSFIYEGGIRVPGILYWKGKVLPKQVISEPVGLVDIMPTICHLSALQHPDEEKLDGVNIWPLIMHRDFKRKKPLSWFFYRTSPEMAMRIGRYSVLGKDLDTTKFTHAFTAPDMHAIKNMSLEDFVIYDLETDPGQEYGIEFSDLTEAESYMRMLEKRLREIQDEGPVWQDLPPATGIKKLKSEWRQLRPDGFSN